MDAGQSFSRLLVQLDEGDEEAYRELFRRFAARLRSLADTRLECRVKRLVDAEDVVQSAFRSFFVRQADGRFDHENWNTLWGLLVVIVLRKCQRKNKYFRAARRDIAREKAASGSSDEVEFRWEAIDREPTPDEATQLVECIEQLLESENERGQSILLHRLNNYKESEICELVGCSERTVRRVISRARDRLQGVLTS